MSASKILEKLQRKGQITPLAQQKNIKSPQNGTQNPQISRTNSITNLLNSSGERPVDPVVARLKAARKAEREQKERELREKKGLGPKKTSTSRPKSTSSTSSTSKQPVRGSGSRPGEKSMGNGAKNRSTLPPSSTPRVLPREKKPKMSFSELMAKASGIDQSKMSIALKQKTKSPEAILPGPKRRGSEQDPKLALASRKPVSQNLPAKKNLQHDRSRPVPSAKKPVPVKTPQPAIQTRAPLPTRKPSSALEAKLKLKSSTKTGHGSNRGENLDEEEEEESDMDSFIASEDEEIEQDEPEYDRDEIWSIFNRGKKRSHFSYDDYDSDDMEATGAEILEEESRSKRNALLEDKREMEKEAKLAALKRARKAGIRR